MQRRAVVATTADCATLPLVLLEPKSLRDYTALAVMSAKYRCSSPVIRLRLKGILLFREIAYG